MDRLLRVYGSHTDSDCHERMHGSFPRERSTRTWAPSDGGDTGARCHRASQSGRSAFLEGASHTGADQPSGCHCRRGGHRANLPQTESTRRERESAFTPARRQVSCFHTVSRSKGGRSKRRARDCACGGRGAVEARQAQGDAAVPTRSELPPPPLAGASHSGALALHGNSQPGSSTVRRGEQWRCGVADVRVYWKGVRPSQTPAPMTPVAARRTLAADAR